MVAKGAEQSLEWPEVCRPLLEQHEGSDYAWMRYCRNYAYGGTDGHADSLLCSLEGRWHHSMVCELFRLASDCSSLPCKTSVATAETIRNGLRRGSAALPRGAGNFTEVILVSAAPAVVTLAPSGKMSFRGFLAMYVVAMLCLREQGVRQQRVYHLRPEPLGRDGCKQLVGEHFQHVFEVLAPGAGVTAKASSKVWALLPKGPLGAADAEPASERHYEKLSKESTWSRFVVRMPRAASAKQEDGKRWLGLQEAWGWQNAWAALRLTAQLDLFYLQSDQGRSAGGGPGGQLEAFLQRLSAERQAMLDGREQVDGEQRQIGYLRWRGSQRTLTPISGNYRSAWRSALLRRARRAGKTAVTVLFTLPSEEKHGARCSAVLNWMDLPMSCEEATHDIEAEQRFSANASLLRIPGSANGCRVVLNRAVLLSAVDATALGIQGCHEWIGVPVVQHNASYAIRPQWLHADSVSISLLQQHVLPLLLQDLFLAAEAVWDTRATQPLSERLALATERIAAFTWYLFSAAMYTRGSAAIAILAHHVLYLWLMRPQELADRRSILARHRLQALRCLPLWRAGTMPDVEAASSHTVDQYVSEVYWASFEGASPQSVRSECLACLERELQVSDDSMHLADTDARQMRRVLRALGASSRERDEGFTEGESHEEELSVAS